MRLYSNSSMWNISWKCNGNCIDCPYDKVKVISQNLLCEKYGMSTAILIGQLQQNVFKYDVTGVCHANYQKIENQVIAYCRINFPAKLPVQQTVRFGMPVVIQVENSCEDEVRQQFKCMIDIAAQAVKEKKPELSIVLDGLGVILADDLLEAIIKIISMLDMAMNM